MTDNQTPPDWVLLEAARRAAYGPDNLHYYFAEDRSFRALCDMIEKYEQPPLDRKVLVAMEATLQVTGYHPDEIGEASIVRAIELWEEGFGK
jgi:hypothetical protein